MLENLQILRALAALAVVQYHVLYTADGYARPVHALQFLHGWGKCGVDVFFVISGFVMVHAQSRRPRPAREFLRQRLLRIVPLYWLLTAALALLTFALPAITRSGVPAPGPLAASFFFLSVVLYRQMPLLFVGWSLEYEVLFYLLFAAAIRRTRVWAFCFVGGSLLLLASFSVVRWVALEFLFGMLVCAWFLNGPPFTPRSATACAAVGLLLLLLASSAQGPEVLLSGLPASLLVLGAASMPQVRSAAGSFLGAASYSIYLAQVFTIPAFYKLTARPLSAVPGDALAVLAVLASVAAGCALHLGVERPAARLFRRRQDSVRPAPASRASYDFTFT